MTDQDRLAEIKDTLRYWDQMHASYGPAPRPPAVAAQEAARHVNRAQIDWLVGQASEVERLRGLLRELAESWSSGVCPSCGAIRDAEVSHTPDCWLAAALA